MTAMSVALAVLFWALAILEYVNGHITNTLIMVAISNVWTAAVAVMVKLGSR